MAHLEAYVGADVGLLGPGTWDDLSPGAVGNSHSMNIYKPLMGTGQKLRIITIVGTINIHEPTI